MNLQELVTQLESLGQVREATEENNCLLISIFNENFSETALDTFSSIIITEVAAHYPNTDFVVLEGNALKASFTK
jgi:hypothetical protein